MNIFIDWPIFSRNSNGVRCIYELSHYLSQAGLSVYGVPRKLRAFFKSLNGLPNEYKNIRIAESPFGSSQDIFIAAETAPARVIHAVRKQGIQVVWWQLAPFRLLDGKLWPKPGDISLPFSSYVNQDSDQYFYYQPLPDIHWRSALSDSTVINSAGQPRICVYNGKGRLKGLESKILALCGRSEIIPITRTIPKKRSMLIDLLKSSHGLISFDEFSAINLEAASLGIPVFLVNPLFDPTCRQRFSVEKFQSMVCQDADEFLRLVCLRMEQKLSSMQLEDLLASNHQTLINWKSLLENPAKFSGRRVTPESLSSLRKYTRSLKRRRIISTHYGGQAGSSWLASSYIADLSAGRIRLPLIVCARILDYAYIFIGPFLIGLERLPILRRLVAKLRRDKLLPVYKSGQATYALDE
jgi:hypothetical protein